MTTRWLLLAMLCLLTLGSANAAGRFTVAHIDPASPATLHSDQDVNVGVDYQSDVPVEILVRAVFDSGASQAVTGGLSRLPPGSGHAYGWFAVRTGWARVTGIRVRMWQLPDHKLLQDTVVPVDFSWDGSNGGSRDTPAWVADYRTADRQGNAVYRQAYPAPPTPAGARLLSGGVALLALAAALGGLVLPIWGLLRWRGGTRWLAAIPATVLVLVLLNIVIGVSLDPSSHNLWPLEFGLWSAGASVYMLLIMLVRRMRTVR